MDTVCKETESFAKSYRTENPTVKQDVGHGRGYYGDITISHFRL